MSSDDGYIIRMNSKGKYILQHYFASAPTYPPIDEPGASSFDTLEEAVVTFGEVNDLAYPCEYGLTVDTKSFRIPFKKEDFMVETRKYASKPRHVDAVQVTAANFTAVAEWCGGDVTDTYIQVPVKNPKTERQSRAFVGDWVLSAKNGFQVYTNAAFSRSFELVSEEIKIENTAPGLATPATAAKIDQEKRSNGNGNPVLTEADAAALRGDPNANGGVVDSGLTAAELELLTGDAS